MNELNITGGARIGFANASYPFAKLKVSQNKLELNASVVGKLIFLPENIISIEPYDGFIGNGIRIIHNVPKYNSKVVFWCKSNPSGLIIQIRETGFLSNTAILDTPEYNIIKAEQDQSGFPLKKGAVITLIVIWNLFLGVGIISSFLKGDVKIAPLFAMPAVFIVFVSLILMLISPAFAGMVLKEGRKVADIKKVVLFGMVIMLLFLIQIGVFLSH
jgi:hypothetical protein